MTRIVEIDNGFLLVSDTGDHSLTHYLETLPDPVVQAIKKQNDAEKAAVERKENEYRQFANQAKSALVGGWPVNPVTPLPTLTEQLSQAA